MRKIFYFWLLVLMVILLVPDYALPATNMNFLLSSLYQDNNRNTVLLGHIDFDELSSKMKNKLISVGYKSGDLVPAKCVLPSLQSKKGIISILVPPATDMKSKKSKDWMRLGSFNPILFDTMQKWAKRKEVQEPETTESLIAALKDKSPKVRKRAAEKLGIKKEKRALRPLIALLKDVNTAVQDQASGSLFRINRNWVKTNAAKEFVPVFIAALKDTNSVNIRSGSAFALAKIGDIRALEPLIETLKDEDWSVRKAAATALGYLNDPRAIEPLIDALGDEHSYVQRNAIAALENLKDPRSVKPLIHVLKDTIQRAQTSASLALDKIDPNWMNTEAAKQTVIELITALKDTNSATVRECAAYAIGKIKDSSAVEPLIVALKDENLYVRMNAAFALGKIKDPRAVDPLIDKLKVPEDKNWSTTSSAVRALGEIKDPRAVEPLIALLNNQNFNFIRDDVNKSLRKITRRGFAANYDSWMNWWTENKENFLKESVTQ